ncbi:MAG: hypothetical protein JSS87_15290 [Acidobacteria bacterium]|nr:hypothetical protein [Acidobacteriota bacterium]
MPGPSSIPNPEKPLHHETHPPVNRKTIVRQKSDALSLLRWLIAGTAAMGIVLSLLPATGHDQLWFLWVGERMLAGAKLYGPEIMEPNPPLIMWLSAAVTAVAHGFYLESTFVFKALQLLLIGGMFVLVERLLAVVTPHFFGKLLRPALLLFFIVAYLVIPARDFGQREHLLSILCLPYLLAASRPQDGSWPKLLRIGIGLLAGIGFCLKPQQVLVFFAAELLLVISRRSLRSLVRPEAVCIVAVGLGYLACVWHFAPAYFTTTLPIIRNCYWAVGHLSILELLLESPQLQVLAILSVAALYLRRKHQCSSLACVLTTAGLAADGAYLQQGTGWYYQQIPGIVFLLAALFVHAAEIAQARAFAPTRWMRNAVAFLSILAAFLTLHFSGYPITPDRSFPIDQPDESLFRPLARGTPIAILSTNVEETIMPRAKYHLFWAQRMNNLWMLPAILHSEPPAANPHHLSAATIQMLADKQHAFMAEDLQRWKPVLVLIERCYDPAVQCQMLEDRHDDLLAWFSRDAAFRAAFAPYRKQGQDGRFDVYTRQ